MDIQEYTPAGNICQPFIIINKKGKTFSFFYPNGTKNREFFCADCAMRTRVMYAYYSKMNEYLHI